MENEKRYTITIVEHGLEKRQCGLKWEKGAGATKEDPGKYGYTPELVKDMPYEREILKQTKAGLDLISVIKAINGL